MMCLLNVYLVCILAAECKKVGCEKRSAYTLKNNNTDGIRTSALYGFSYNWLTYIYFNWILQDSKNTNLKYSWKDNK